jgi:hypothetical protein
MKSLNAKQQKQFIGSDLAAQVRLAEPLARELIMEALDGTAHYQNDDHHRIGYVAALLGHDGPRCADDQLDKIEQIADAAYALGIAVGQLLSPGVFAQKDGAR